jgi:hypothetical protein
MDTGAVPTENLPVRSHEAKSSSTRHVLVRQQSGPSSESVASSSPLSRKQKRLMNLQDQYSTTPKSGLYFMTGNIQYQNMS